MSENKKVLDVGCGFGGTIDLINQTHTNIELTGVNIDLRQIKRAKKMVKPINNNIIEFRVGNANEMSFKNSSFDIILAVECIFHFDREFFFVSVKDFLNLMDF